EPADSSAQQIATDHATEAAARDWLRLTDSGDWAASYENTGDQFRRLNTLELWRNTSQDARTPLGPMLARDAIGYQSVNAPPRGYRIVTFRTYFTNRPEAKETITLEREDDAWKVVGYIIE
ncbi:MAG: DUF4019 domain-containing protein, partial [Pontixanthobacter sp.]